MLVFTWNLQRTEQAFKLALDHLSQCGDSFVAAFQELPGLADSTEKAQQQAVTLSGQRVRCLGVVGSFRTPGRLGLFSSSDVTRVGSITSDSNYRTAMVVLRQRGRQNVGVVGVHAVDRRNVASEYARNVWANLSRVAVETFWKPNWPLIVLGDFNADPYHPELSSCLGWFALRDRTEAAHDWESPLLNEPMRPLYNPTWHLLPEGLGRPGGTLCLNSHDQGVRWRICDQILVSRELITKLNGQPQIIAKIGETELLTKQGRPRAKVISDHLPIQLSVSI